jgi:TonB family protein
VFEHRQTSATTTLSVVVVHAVLIGAALGSGQRHTAPTAAPPPADTVYWHPPQPAPKPAPEPEPPLEDEKPWRQEPRFDPELIGRDRIPPSTFEVAGRTSRDWLKAYRDSIGTRVGDSSGTEPLPYWADSPEVLAAGPRHYPERLRMAGVEGHVVIEAVLDTTGRIQPQSLIVIVSTHPEFETPAAAYVRQTLFRPARLNGKAVSARIRVPVDFVLRR